MPAGERVDWAIVLRDLCVVERGEEHCRDAIEAHDACLRRDGFSVPQKVWPAQGGAAPR